MTFNKRKYYRDKYKNDPEFRRKMKVSIKKYQKTSPKYKAYQKVYRKAYQKTDKCKAYRKAYQKKLIEDARKWREQEISKLKEVKQ